MGRNLNKNFGCSTDSSISKVLRCPSCNASSKTIIFKERKDADNFLYCISCKAEFSQNKKDSFFLFFKGESKRRNSFLSEYNKDIYTNRNFRELILSNEIANLKLVLKECSAKVMVDIGCGNGGYAKTLDGLYQEYYGFEPSEIPGKGAIEESYLPKNAILLHYNLLKNLPLHNESVDVVTFIASYDHIPDAENVVKDVYNKLKINGYLIILMQNNRFWVRQIMNRIRAEKLFKGGKGDHHYRVHSPDTLIKEIRSFVNIKVEFVRADFFFLPNLPKQLRFIYLSKNVMILVNFLLRYFFSLISKTHIGSVMIVVFKKN